jgi:hypothetical protein
MGYSSPTPTDMDNEHGNQSTILFGFCETCEQQVSDDGEQCIEFIPSA